MAVQELYQHLENHGDWEHGQVYLDVTKGSGQERKSEKEKNKPDSESGITVRLTYGWTEKPSYRDARMHLKMTGRGWWAWVGG